ncbi:MAG: hypothetical protein ACYTCU_05885 [Planctomycetota bacterium]
MQAHTTPAQPFLTWRRLLMPALCVVSVLMLAVAAPAQDSDDDGVLPTGTTGDQHSPAGAGSSADTSVGVTAAMDDDVLDPKQASIALSSLAGDTTLETEVEAADATFVAATGGMTIQQSPGVVELQGRGMLLLHGNLLPVLQPPTDAIVGALVLVIGDGTASLDDLKNGLSQPLMVAVLGGLMPFDLSYFQAVVMHHADDLAGLSVSLVVVSLDSQGALHTSAVRLAASGGPLEVVTE